MSGFYGFHQPREDRLHRADGWLAPWLDIAARVKTLLLVADLKALGNEAVGSQPRCSDLPRLDGPAECFGCLYVFEGSTFCGQVVSRQLRDTLRGTPANGGRSFNGCGARTGPMWQKFRAAPAGCCAAHGMKDEVVTTARNTFEMLRAWCQQTAV